MRAARNPSGRIVLRPQHPPPRWGIAPRGRTTVGISGAHPCRSAAPGDRAAGAARPPTWVLSRRLMKQPADAGVGVRARGFHCRAGALPNIRLKNEAAAAGARQAAPSGGYPSSGMRTARPLRCKTCVEIIVVLASLWPRRGVQPTPLPDSADVVAIFGQVGGEGGAKGMRTDALGDASGFGRRANGLLQTAFSGVVAAHNAGARVDRQAVGREVEPWSATARGVRKAAPIAAPSALG